jgi:hypothetical protein
VILNVPPLSRSTGPLPHTQSRAQASCYGQALAVRHAFTVVSDPGNTIAGRLGILTRPSPEARAAELHLGLDLTGVNADGTVTLPMPADATPGAVDEQPWRGHRCGCSASGRNESHTALAVPFNRSRRKATP